MKIVALVVISLAAVTVSFSALGNEERKRKICMTKECKNIARNIIQHINTKVKPCDDFYEFACGQYLKHTAIPNNKCYIESFNTIENTIRRQLGDILKALNPNETKPIIFSKQLYKMCLNSANLEEQGLSYFKDILTQLGGWPVVYGNKWIARNFDWKKIIYLLRRIGYSTDYLIKLNIEIDWRNTSRYIIMLSAPSFALPSFGLCNPNFTYAETVYFKKMLKVAVALGANRDLAEKELKQSLDFEISLSHLLKSKTSYERMTVRNLNKNYSYIDWNDYLNNVLNIPDIHISSDDEVYVISPEYFSRLKSVLNRTSKRTLANYIVWKVIQFSVPYLPQQFRGKMIPFDKAQNGNLNVWSRSEECVNIVAHKLSFVLGSLYIKKYFNKRTKEIVERMVKDIKVTFADTINSWIWMDNVTKHNALEKVTALEALVGYSELAVNKRKLREYYSQLQLDTKSYLTSILSIDKFLTNKKFQKLKKEVNRLEWSEELAYFDVNAFYIRTKNTIQIAAGILREIYLNNLQYINYAYIGFTLGHEITHGFDYSGINFDKYGNQVNWLTNETNLIFKRKAECLIKQYNNYIIPELGIYANMSSRTRDDDIADNGGTKFAYHAYQKWVNHNSIEPGLPGLNYTTNQLFWIYYAMTWCSKFRKEFLQNVIATAHHSLPRFRVIGPLSNSNDFAHDFNCPVGSKMNPKHKCQIW